MRARVARGRPGDDVVRARTCQGLEMKKTFTFVAVVAFAAPLAGCYTPESRAVGGGAAGALAGAGIGGLAGGGRGAVAGALIGGATGAAAGALTAPPPPPADYYDAPPRYEGGYRRLRSYYPPNCGPYDC